MNTPKQLSNAPEAAHIDEHLVEVITMNKMNSFAAMMLTAALSIPALALACGAPGSTTHVGGLMAVDQDNKSFTILDAQSGSPVSFVADDGILESLGGASGVIQVTYEQTGETLRALAVSR